MKTINREHLSLPLTWVLCVGLLLLCSCTKQATDHCPTEVIVNIEAVDEDGSVIDDPTVIEGVVLYVFDADKQFLQTLQTDIGSIEPIFFPNQDILHIVSWGNLTETHQKLPEVYPGMPMHEALVQLKTSADESQQAVRTQSHIIAQSPDDLFYSYDVISLNSGHSETYKLSMSRSSAAMTITMRNLQAYANRYDENYSLLVRETYDAIDFYGRLTGEKVGYIPASSFNDKKEMIAPLFNLLPSHPEGTIEIDVYHDGELITTVQNGPDGLPLKAQRGQVLNILVNFHLTVTVEVGMTPWGVTQIWKEY